VSDGVLQVVRSWGDQQREDLSLAGRLFIPPLGGLAHRHCDSQLLHIFVHWLLNHLWSTRYRVKLREWRLLDPNRDRQCRPLFWLVSASCPLCDRSLCPPLCGPQTLAGIILHLVWCCGFSCQLRRKCQPNSLDRPRPACLSGSRYRQVAVLIPP
jgi:hypothetical protein